MKILTNKTQIELMTTIKNLNLIIAKSNIDDKAFNLLADIGCSALEPKHLSMLITMLEKELENEK